MKTNQVCLVILFQGVIDSITTFTDDKKGNEQCEELFFQKVKNIGGHVTATNVDEFMDDYGDYYEDSKHFIQIVHS